MKSRFQGMRALAMGLAAGAMTALYGASAFAEELVGQPTPGAIGLQAGVTALRDDAAFFHNSILMPIITGITLVVLGLLVWVILRYNKRANPVPARWSHNTPLEVIWTLVPVLILVFIAIFSFKLLYAYHDMPKPDLTVKATGYQWYWGYEYPDQKIPEYVSNLLPEDKAKAKGVPYRLAATQPLVVPQGKVVKVLITGADVIHAFAIPALGVGVDAWPGRVNEAWFKVDRLGTYYGQCRQLCGVDHAFMPIELHVVTQKEFDDWVASKHGAAATPTQIAAGKTPETPAAATTSSATNTPPAPKAQAAH